MIATSDCRTSRMEALALVIESEFNEMPGLRLTLAQARRLWNLSNEDCLRVLDDLIAGGRLVRDEEGRYCRWCEHGS